MKSGWRQNSVSGSNWMMRRMPLSPGMSASWSRVSVAAAPSSRGRPGDDALDAWLLAGDLGDPGGFFDALLEGGLALQEDHALDRKARRRLPIVFDQVRAVQKRDIGEPGVAQLLWVPDVQVGVDDAEVRHGSFLLASGNGAGSNSPKLLTWRHRAQRQRAERPSPYSPASVWP